MRERSSCRYGEARYIDGAKTPKSKNLNESNSVAPFEAFSCLKFVCWFLPSASASCPPPIALTFQCVYPLSFIGIKVNSAHTESCQRLPFPFVSFTRWNASKFSKACGVGRSADFVGKESVNWIFYGVVVPLPAQPFLSLAENENLQSLEIETLNTARKQHTRNLTAVAAVRRWKFICLERFNLRFRRVVFGWNGKLLGGAARRVDSRNNMVSMVWGAFAVPNYTSRPHQIEARSIEAITPILFINQLNIQRFSRNQTPPTPTLPPGKVRNLRNAPLRRN